MNQDGRADKLQQAAKLIAEVAADLDRGVSNCGHCGSYQYENREHYHMGVEMMDAMVRKCEGFANKLRLGLDVWQKREKV